MTVAVAVAEPDEIIAAVLLHCLKDAPFSTRRASANPPDLERELQARPADVVVVGPGIAQPAFAPVTTRFLAVGSRTLVVTDRAGHDAALPLLLAGASGLVFIDDASCTDITEAVLAVASGTTALHPAVVEAVLRRWRASRHPTADAAPSEQNAAINLTTRELQVLEGLNDGLSNRMLAARLGVAEKTVETHKSRLYTKLGARNQAHAVRLALDRRLLDPGRLPGQVRQEGGHVT